MKKIISFFLIIIICLSISAPALAASTLGATHAETAARAEQTEWRYRVYNGEPQKRLWSITYSRWLTDWMPLSAAGR